MTHKQHTLNPTEHTTATIIITGSPVSLTIVIVALLKLSKAFKRRISISSGNWLFIKDIFWNKKILDQISPGDIEATVTPSGAAYHCIQQKQPGQGGKQHVQHAPMSDEYGSTGARTSIRRWWRRGGGCFVRLCNGWRQMLNHNHSFPLSPHGRRRAGKKNEGRKSLQALRRRDGESRRTSIRSCTNRWTLNLSRKLGSPDTRPLRSCWPPARKPWDRWRRRRRMDLANRSRRGAGANALSDWFSDSKAILGSGASNYWSAIAWRRRSSSRRHWCWTMRPRRGYKGERCWLSGVGCKGLSFKEENQLPFVLVGLTTGQCTRP